MNPDIVKYIEEIAEEKRKQYMIVTNSKIVRDNVFNILNQTNRCIVLYYPLRNEHNKAFHVSKQIGDESYHFVYINTEHEKEKQAFAAAHELGHIWNIDGLVEDRFRTELKNEDREKVINRFVAEFMMPKEIFAKTADEKVFPMIKNGKINNFDLINISVYLMYYFFQPYTSIIIRFCELKKIREEDRDNLLEVIEKSPYIIKNIIATEQYPGIGIKDRSKSIKDIAELIEEAEKKETLPDSQLEYLRRTFDIEKSEVQGTRGINYGE